MSHPDLRLPVALDSREASARYRALLGAIEQGYCVLEVLFDGDDAVDYRFLEVNAAFEDRTGLRDAVGKRGREMEPLLEGHWFETYGRVARIRKPERFANESPATGQWYEGLAFPVGEPGENRIGVLFSDVTARHRLEEQLRRAAKMEAFGQLAGGVACDFNNLLTVISGHCELALQSLDDPEAAGSMLREVMQAADRVAKLNRQLMSFGRGQAVAPQPLDLSAAADDTLVLLRRLIGDDVRLVADLEPDVWPVLADPEQLGQSLVNLAVNARDAMPEGGTLTVSTRNEVLGDTAAAEHPDARPGPHAVLSVADTGTGMTEAVRARIFEPFFTTKAAGQGTGLGLATVSGIVRRAGGHVRVRSRVGEGSTFDVYLPCTTRKAPRRGTRPGALPRGTETVLVIEGEAAVRRLVRTVLTARGYTVLEAADGANAEWLASAHSGPIHLLLSDVGASGVGSAVAAVLAKHPNARVLFMSASTDDAPARLMVPTAEAGFLQKPFSSAALDARVRQALND